MAIFDVNSCEEKIGYVFKDKMLLRQCFTHASYAFEHGENDNELLEFFHAIDSDDAKLIVKNDMIDIYFIQKLTHYKKYYELLLILEQVNILMNLKDDYIYKFIIKIFNFIKSHPFIYIIFIFCKAYSSKFNKFIDHCTITPSPMLF